MQLLKLQEKGKEDNSFIKFVINNKEIIKKQKKQCNNKINTIENKIIDLKQINKLYLNFDNHYMLYITYRQQRDNIIFNEVIKNILNLCSINKNSIGDLCLSVFFKIKKNNTLEINEEILPINKKDIAKRIEVEIKILKTYNLLFCNLKKHFGIDNVFIKALPVKIKKVKDLNDISFLNRITKSITFSNKIISELPEIKSFSDIDEDMILYNKIINELL